MTVLLGATADAPGDEPLAAQAEPRSSRMRLSYATDVPAESLPGLGGRESENCSVTTERKTPQGIILATSL
jgi:hypothetical protein